MIRVSSTLWCQSGLGRSIAVVSVIGISSLYLAACGEDIEPTSTPTPTDGATGGAGDAGDVGAADGLITYQQHIRPLVEANCVGCHTEGGIAPFSMDTWERVSERGQAIVEAIQTRKMPPYGMNDDCRDIQDSLRLSEEALALAAAWEEQGYLEGDVADYVAPPIEAPLEMGTPDYTMQLPEPYLPDVSAPDDYRCFVLDETFEDDLFVVGGRVDPDQLTFVHHVIVYVINEGEVGIVEQLDAEDEGIGYTCFGDPGTENATLLVGWAPGTMPWMAREGDAVRVMPGARLVVQMHYSLVGNDTEDIAPDQTAFSIWTLPDGEVPDSLLSFFPVVDQQLDIGAGLSEVVEQTIQRIPLDGEIVGAAPHMHLLGQTLQTELVRPNGDVECLSDIPDWDFNWQRSYRYEPDAIVPVSFEDQIVLTCTYDNSAANQPVVNGEQQVAADVHWGDGSVDEMCLNFVTVRTPYRGVGNGTVCDGFWPCYEECPDGDPFCALACMGGAGLSCLFCSFDVIFGSCGTANCAEAGLPFLECLQPCVAERGSYLDCIYDACGEQFSEYFSCWEQTLQAGSCPDDVGSCTGLYRE